jgi:DNA-binding NarL/FixJ family response regulator
LEDGRWDRTAARAEEALLLVHALGDRLMIADVLPRLAAVALHQGQPVEATRLLAATNTIRTDLGVPASVTDRAAYQDALTAARIALGEEAFGHTWAAGASSTLNEIVAEALQVSRGRAYEANPGSVKTRNGGTLTRRELDVLLLLAAGRTDREIAEALFISPRTVMAHVRHIFAKLGVRTRKAAAVVAREHGLV